MKALSTILLITILTFWSCDETKKVIDVAGNVQLSGAYTVQTISGAEVVAEKNPSITFNALDKSVRGNTGCNSFFGSYTLDLYALGFKEIASTEMACEREIMDGEVAFLNALNATGSYTLQRDELTLYSANDRSVLLTATKDRNETE